VFSEKKILIVEDNPMTLKLIEASLKKNDFLTSTVSNGEECLNFLRKGKADLVLLDVMMPGINGIGVLKYIRENYGQLELPVIMVTSKEEDNDIIEALNLGANDYICKPVRIEILLARIKTQLGSVFYHNEFLKLKELEAIRALIITYNHELNTPLTVAMSLVKRDQKNSQFSDRILQSLERMNIILKKIQNIINNSPQYIKYSENSKMLKVEK